MRGFTVYAYLWFLTMAQEQSEETKEFVFTSHPNLKSITEK